MKKTFTPKGIQCVVMFLLLFFTGSLQAQVKESFPTESSSTARCAGFTAEVTNGSLINLCSGSSVTLNGSPTTAGLLYKWQKQTSAGGPFVDISGATASTYSTNILGAYRVLIANGSCIDTSAIANVIRLNVEGGTISSANTTIICNGNPGGMLTGTTVPGSSEGIISFTWEKNENNTGWSVIPNATNLDYSVGPVTTTTAYRRISKDNCGNTAASNVVTFTTTTALSAGTVSPASQTIVVGATPAPLTATTATGGSGNISYQWQSAPFERGTFNDIAGATSASYSPGALGQTTYFRRVALDNNCLTTAATIPVVVYVSNAPLLAGSFTIGSSCFFTGMPAAALEMQNPPTGGVPPYTTQWQMSTDKINWTSIAGANGPVYNPGVLTTSTWFRNKVTDAAGTVDYTAAESITHISTTLTAGTIKTTSPVACIGSSPATIVGVVSPTGYGERLNFQWQYKNATTGTWIDIPNEIRASYTPSPIAEKTSFRRLTVDACGLGTRTAISNEVEIDIRPELFAGSIQPSSQMIYNSGTPAPLNSSTAPYGGTGAYSVSWEQSNLAVGPWTTIVNATSASYAPPALQQTTYYRRVVKDEGCLATKYTYVVEVYLNLADTLKGGNLRASTCVFAGYRPSKIESQLPLVSGGVLPYSFQWESRTGTTGSFNVITGATTENYQPSVITATTQYRRRVTDAVGNSAYSDTVTINYIATQILPGTIAAAGSTALCQPTTGNHIRSVVDGSLYGEAAHYQWQSRTTTGEWTNIPGATNGTYTTGMITQTTYFRRAFSDECGGVVRTVYSNEVVFTVGPLIKIKAGIIDGPIITCTGTAPGIIRSVLDACGTGMNYQWEINTGSGWNTINGATGASYTPGVMNTDTRFRRKVVDGCGTVVYSNEVEIFVYPPIEPGVIGSVSQTVCENGTSSIIKLLSECHYTDGTVTYQWQQAASATGPWSDVAGANANQLQPTTGTTNKYYRLMVKSTTCSAVAYTNVAEVLVRSACATSITSNSTTFCFRSTQPVILTYNTGTCNNPQDYSYEWEFSPNGTTNWTSTSENGVNLDVHSFFDMQDKTVSFRVRIMNTACQTATYSNVITITKVVCSSPAISPRIERVSLFPNPSVAGETITLKLDESESYKVEMSSIDGRKVSGIATRSSNGKIQITVPSNVENGTYMIVLKNGKKQIVQKLIVQ
ncbi:MAG: thrombospondin type 3 repeat family [Segetibacter sp.]|nr:thrombospondin type 3 repeat family [Segetibacter sp.]